MTGDPGGLSRTRTAKYQIRPYGLIDAMATLPLAAALSLAPFPYGSVAPAWVAIWLLLLGVSTASGLFLATGGTGVGQVLPYVAVAATVLCMAALQSADDTVPAFSNGIWTDLQAAGIEGGGERLAVDALSPLAALGVPLSAILGFVSAYLLAMRKGTPWTIVRILVLAGAFHAMLGFVVNLALPGNVLLEQKVSYRFDFTGPFVNRNTAASYFGICTLASAALTFRSMREFYFDREVSFRALVILVTDAIASRALIYVGITLMCLAATIMTGSRAGGLATLVALLAMTAALTLRSVATFRARVLVSLSLICVLALLALLFGGGNLADRLQEGFSEDGRKQVWSAVVTAIRSNFWFGTGLGTFPEVFPSIRTEAVGYGGIWERAHSTPAELALTLGVPLTALVLLAWTWLIWAHLRAAISASQSYTLPTLGCAALLLASLHGSVDFSLQIPGFVIPFAVLVGTTLGYGVRRSMLRGGGDVRFGRP